MVLILVEAGERDEFMQMAQQHFCDLNPEFKPAADWQSSYFEKIQQNPALLLCWILADGQRAGFVLFGVEDHRFLPRKTGMIYELYVVPEQRRRGIAKASAEAVIQELQKSSPTKIQLEVVAGNTAALQLWESLGFQKVSERFVLAERGATK